MQRRYYIIHRYFKIEAPWFKWRVDKRERRCWKETGNTFPGLIFSAYTGGVLVGDDS